MSFRWSEIMESTANAHCSVNSWQTSIALLNEYKIGRSSRFYHKLSDIVENNFSHFALFFLSHHAAHIKKLRWECVISHLEAPSQPCYCVLFSFYTPIHRVQCNIFFSLPLWFLFYVRLDDFMHWIPHYWVTRMATYTKCAQSTEFDGAAMLFVFWHLKLPQCIKNTLAAHKYALSCYKMLQTEQNIPSTYT